MSGVIHCNSGRFRFMASVPTLCGLRVYKNLSTDKIEETTCGNCLRTNKGQRLQKIKMIDKIWGKAIIHGESFEILDKEKVARRLQITTKPLTPEEAAVVVDCLLENIPKYLLGE
jgi:hypothetical protein